jgi:hypothetical protein
MESAVAGLAGRGLRGVHYDLKALIEQIMTRAPIVARRHRNVKDDGEYVPRSAVRRITASS